MGFETFCCPAMLVAAPASGQGKTSVTAALARWHRRQGRRVRVFKTGPDFIDPMLHEQASGAPVYQLDLFMGGEAEVAARLHAAAADADLILVEGVMGLHDGEPSSADLARRFGLPVLLVLDARAMAQTFGALVHGLASWRGGVTLAGVVANQVGSAGHAAMLAPSLPEGVPLLAALPRDPALALPERHLGLVQAAELPDLDRRLDAWADAWQAAAQACGQLDFMPAAVAFAPAAVALPVAPALHGVRVAVGRDAVCSFIYRANLDALAGLGAELVFFSPLADSALPACDAVWLPGGYPELHLDALARNTTMAQALQAHHAAGKPMLAECGGLLLLLQTLTDAQGQGAAMFGLLPGHGVLQSRLAGLGLHSAALPEGELRGHAFHHSLVETPMAPLLHTRPLRGRRGGEAVYRSGRLTATYFHAYFPSNPAAVAALLGPADVALKGPLDAC